MRWRTRGRAGAGWRWARAAGEQHGAVVDERLARHWAPAAAFAYGAAPSGRGANADAAGVAACVALRSTVIERARPARGAA